MKATTFLSLSLKTSQEWVIACGHFNQALDFGNLGQLNFCCCCRVLGFDRNFPKDRGVAIVYDLGMN